MSKPAPTVLWRPQPGPQMALLTCPCNDILFGGARGGGKTSAMIGHFISRSARYGKDHQAVWFRRSLPEIEGAQVQMQALLPQLGAAYAVQARTWTMPNGATLKLRYLENDTDAGRYQGHEYCVAVGTPILMSDGSYKPIEAIAVGDLVATLEGPRPVVGTVNPYMAPCVEVTVYDRKGAERGKQVHPVWHPVLQALAAPATASTAQADQAHPLSPTSGHSSKYTARSRQIASLPQHGSTVPCGADTGFRRGEAQEIPGWFAFSASGQTACRESAGELQAKQPPVPLSVPVVLLARSHQSAASRSGCCCGDATGCCFHCKSGQSSSRSFEAMPLGSSDHMQPCGPSRSSQGRGAPCQTNEAVGVQIGPETVAGFQAGCPTADGCDDGRARACQETARGGIPSRCDVEESCRDCLPRERVPGSTPTHTRHHQAKWAHPYTGEERDLFVPVEDGTAVFVPCGQHLVADISVAGANHYISSAGLVNKNTSMYLDELGTFPRPEPIDMLRATLRSAAGVPTQMVASANPGGVGHAWIKARYLDPAPPMTPFLGADGQQRVFIPSRVTDNPALLKADPTYIDRLKASGPPWLVRAWLEGDWNATLEGDLIKAEWLQHFYQELPREDMRGRVLLSVDTAIKAGKDNDYTVIIVAIEAGSHLYLADLVRGKWEFPQLVQRVRAVASQWRPSVVLIEDKGSGQSLIQQLEADGFRFPVIPATPTADKVTRMFTETGALESGKVLLPEFADWVRDFQDECLIFPKGGHDDQVDALSQLLRYLREGVDLLAAWG